MTRKYRSVARIITLLPVIALTSSCYLFKQGTYLFSYNMRSRPIADMLKDSALNETYRKSLERVEDVQRFAEEELGLRRGRNYTRFVDIGKPYLADIVSAAGKTSFTQYLWSFPFFGSFPYKGFFSREDAEKEAESLRKKNLDVLIRKVDAFSTLGFFSDPVFSFMTGYSPYEIANLIIHENTHATLFLKDRVDFNEQLATFVGNEGALLYMEKRFGRESEEYRMTLDRIADEKTFIAFLKAMYASLDTVYGSRLSDEEKLRRKDLEFAQFREDFKASYDERFRTDRYRGFGDMMINNAYLAVYATYTARLDAFYSFHEALGSDLRKTIECLLELKDRAGDPYEFLSSPAGS